MPLLEAEVRTINVHALGPSGSGKTVFMAAMYPQLRIKRGEADFYLKTDHATSVHMNSVFNAVPNPQEVRLLAGSKPASAQAPEGTSGPGLRRQHRGLRPARGPRIAPPLPAVRLMVA